MNLWPRMLGVETTINSAPIVIAADITIIIQRFVTQLHSSLVELA
jgi:hypothetical protein